MMTRLYYMLLGVLLGSVTVLVMSILNLILISYIGIMFILKTGIEYESKKNCESLRDVFNIRSLNPDISDCMFALSQNGQERDVLQAVSSETLQLLEQLRYRSATFCRDMIKHKKLNDANNIFNRMV